MSRLPEYVLLTSIDYGHEYYTNQYRDMFQANDDKQAQGFAADLRTKHYAKQHVESCSSKLYEFFLDKAPQLVETVAWKDAEPERAAIPAKPSQPAGFYQVQ